jgi:hypothetical protein
MSEQTPKSFETEVRETVLKSSLTGVAATVLAVTFFSPAGFGGMIGTSLASGFGVDPNAQTASDNIYASLPAYPSPLTQQELSDIRGELARTTASLEITRAATEAKIEHIRSISLTQGAVSFAPLPVVVAAPTPVTSARADLRPTTLEAPLPPANVDRDTHLELAELMFAHENL